MKELITSQGLGEEVSNIHVSANVLHFDILTFDVLAPVASMIVAG